VYIYVRNGILTHALGLAGDLRRAFSIVRVGNQIDALMFVKGLGGTFSGLQFRGWGDVPDGLLLGCGQDRDGPLQMERKLL